MQRFVLWAALVLALVVGAAACDEIDEQTDNPTATPAQSTNPALSPTPSETVFALYFVVLEDNGASGDPIGCGDSVVPTGAFSPLPLEVEAKVSTALSRLFEERDQYYGEEEYYNALYQSELDVESVTLDDAGGVTVALLGNLQVGGECDAPRIQAQIEQTAGQFSDVRTVTVLLNGVPLEDVLSLQE